MQVEIKQPEERFGMTRYGFIKLDGQKFKGFDEEDFRDFIKQEIKDRDVFKIPLPETEEHWMFVYKNRLHMEHKNGKAQKLSSVKY